MNIYDKIINFKTNLLLFSGKWGPNERGPTPFVKLCRFGGSGFGIGKERFVTTSTKGACKGDWLGELDVVSDGEVVFEDVVVVEEEDDEVFSLVTFVLSIACFASSVTLILLLAEWQEDDSSTGSKGAASSGVGGAIRLWVGCELKKKLNTNILLQNTNIKNTYLTESFINARAIWFKSTKDKGNIPTLLEIFPSAQFWSIRLKTVIISP